MLSKRPPPSPDKPTTGGFKQRRTEGLSPEGATIITGAQHDVGPLEVLFHICLHRHSRIQLRAVWQVRVSLKVAQNNVRVWRLCRTGTTREAGGDVRLCLELNACMYNRLLFC